MDVTSLHKILKKIRLYLVFFCLSLALACGRKDAVHIEQIDYEGEKAVGVSFSTAMDVEELRVFIGEESQTSVIGVIVSAEDRHSFTPVVAFSPGQTYTLRKNNTEVLATFFVPKREGTEPAELLAIYPKMDTVPENLLKMYFEFAQPMQEVGNSLDFIRVTNETEGIEEAPFLQLESELWNKERTLLTLWLDPGRIKTDLIPNREKGLPLRAGNTYTLTLDPNWKTRRGVPLKQKYTKTFTVGKRDDRKPEPDEWTSAMESSGDAQALIIDFGEPMDAFLSREAIHFFDATDKQRINGRTDLLENDHGLRFTPDSLWTGKEIEIRIPSRLEDLAGNNLLRRFDNPISDGDTPETTAVKFHILRYKMKE